LHAAHEKVAIAEEAAASELLPGTVRVGFSPRVKLDQGLRDTFTWFANNAAWWSGS
jgi:hypothetical protein